MNYMLGIDGGGTKTLAVCADIEVNILGVGMSGGSNYHAIGLEKAIDAIKQATEQAISKANIGKSDISIAYMGLAGAGREKDRAILTQAIDSLIIADKVIVKHDAFIALAGATACKAGVIVIAGTGSMAFGVNQFGQESRSNGWGNILGDEGSAYYISQKALISACRAFDGRGKKTALLGAIKGHFGLDDFSEIIYKIYSSSSQDIAAVAPIVSQTADLGDEIAIEILKDAGRELALSAIAVIKNLCMDEPIQVTTAGSVFDAGEILTTSFEETLIAYNHYVEIINPKFKPVVGALLLALREKGMEIDNVILDKLSRYYL
jgi:N-acetylglucosamine kinase-like BadF-type ATPase